MLEIPGVKLLVAMVSAAKDISGTRILEALIVAAITTLATGYIAVRILEEKTSSLSQRMDVVEKNANERYAEIRGDIRRLYELVLEDRAQGRTRR